jgi:protein phosphatase
MNPRGGPVARLRWSGQTDRGHVRKNNEDSFLVQQFNAQEVHHLGKVGEGTTELVDFVFAVSDGMGGAMAGEFASRITTEKITRLLPPSFKQSALGLTAGVDDVLEELFDQIHRSLVFVGSSYEETHNMQATLSMCWFTPGWMYFAHIGDTRIYYLPAAGGIKQLSEDDTYVGWLFRQGQLTEMQAREHPQRTALQKALGAGNQFVTPQIGGVGYEPGDLFLLCSDGLVEGLFDYQILELLRPASPAPNAPPPAFLLVDEALQRSGRDNTTALVIEVL